MKTIFEGVATALTTPFTSNGIDYERFEKRIERQLNAKVDALVFMGTTGESPTITHHERRTIIEFAVSRLKGKIPIIIGTGSNCTQTACEMTNEAKALGADCALIVTPYYNRCEQDGLILHYSEISKTCKFPYIVYNVPKRTGVNVEPTTALRILSDGYAFGLKEANTNLNHVYTTLNLVAKTHPVYCGADELTSVFLKNGARGTISVASNVIPSKIKEYISDFESNYENHNNMLEPYFSEFFNLLSTKVNPIPIKCIESILYQEPCIFRLPLSTPTSDYFEYLKATLNKLNITDQKETIC